MYARKFTNIMERKYAEKSRKKLDYELYRRSRKEISKKK